MAARIRRPRHTEETKAKIQAALIIGRLQDCVAGKITLDAQQVSSAKILLNKVLPDVSSVDITGDLEAFHYVLSAPPTQDEQIWENQYADREKSPEE